MKHIGVIKKQNNGSLGIEPSKMKLFFPPERNFSRNKRRTIIFLGKKFDSKRERRESKEPADQAQGEERERERAKQKESVREK